MVTGKTFPEFVGHVHPQFYVSDKRPMASCQTGSKPFPIQMMTKICDRVMCLVNTLRPRQNGCYLADNSFKCTFLNGDV